MGEESTISAAPAQETGANQNPSPAGTPTQGSWRDTLPDELKASPALAKYTDQNAALKALVDAQEIIGRKTEGVKVPGQDAKPEELEAFYKALGRPDSADKYAMPKVEGLPDGYGIQPELEKTAREALFGLGLNQKQFEGAMNALVQNSLSELKTKEAFRVSELKAFNDQYKDAAPKRLELARKAVMAVGGDALMKALDETGAGNHRAVYDAFAKLGEQLGENGLKATAGAPGAVDFSKLPPVERLNKAREMGIKP